MDESNPFASPQSDLAPQPFVAQVADEHGLWRDGKTLVMRRDAQLPDRCIKTGDGATGRLKRNLNWHHPALFLTVLAGLLVYVIVALILTKRATIYIGLSERGFAIRRRATLIGWALVLASVGAIVIAIQTAEPLLGLLGAVMFFVGAIYGLARARLVSPTKIDDQFIWLKGAHPDFLASLPAVPDQH